MMFMLARLGSCVSITTKTCLESLDKDTAHFNTHTSTFGYEHTPKLNIVHYLVYFLREKISNDVVRDYPEMPGFTVRISKRVSVSHKTPSKLAVGSR